MKIIKITSKNWREFKDIRLQALKLDPQAFGDSYNVLIKKDNNFFFVLLSSRSQVLYGAYDELRVIGTGSIKYAKALKFNHIAHLSGIYVMKEFRGRGVGKLLFEALIRIAFSNLRIKKLKLIVNMSQKGAIALYKSFKFKKIGDLKEEFNIDGTFHDAYLMELHNKS